MLIKRFSAKKILNSKGNYSLEVSSNGFFASVPSGTSKGRCEKPDFTLGIDEAVRVINRTECNVNIKSFSDLKKLGDFFSELGANPTVATQICALRMITNDNVHNALTKKPRLPRPLGNCVGGGAHATGPDFQEFIVAAPKAKTFFEASIANFQTYKEIEDLLGLHDLSFRHIINSEGAWQTNLSNLEVLKIVSKAADNVSDRLGVDIKIGLDIAASSFFKKGYYIYNNFSSEKKRRVFSPRDHRYFLEFLIDKFRLYYLEDPFESSDFTSFSHLDKNKALICGDDLTCTNPILLNKAIQNNSINSIIIKPNQIGCLVETFKTVSLAKKNNIVPIISHRSCETTDTWLSNLAVGFDTPFIKCGVFGPERNAKLQELINIERKLLKV